MWPEDDNFIDRWFDLPYSVQVNKKQNKETKMTLQTGDRVRLRYGKQTLIVEETFGSGSCYARYEHSGSLVRKQMREFVKVSEAADVDKGYGKMKGKLFETKDGRFGVGLAVNSKGEYVLEMKGTGDLEAFDPKLVEVVMPFTFAVKFSTGNTEYQYLGKEGTVAVGDLLLALDSKHKNGGISIGQVTAVNTKSEKANKEFEGVKVVTQPLGAEQ